MEEGYAYLYDIHLYLPVLIFTSIVEYMRLVITIMLVILALSSIGNSSYAVEEHDEDEEHASMIHGGKSVLNMHVELLIAPEVIEPGREVTFSTRFMDNVTGKLLSNISHTLVIVASDGRELLREHAESADYIHTFVFGEEHKGQVMVRLEDINNTNESIEFALTVVPEFPYAVLTIGIASILAVLGRWLRIRIRIRI